MKVIVSDPISDEGLKILRKNGIEIIDGLGDKIRSSSDLTGIKEIK